MKNKKKLLGAAACTAAALVLTACGGGGSGPSQGAGEPVIDGTLTVAINEDPGNLLRHINSSATLSYVYPWAYEAPVYFDADGEAQGWLAESWEETPTSLQFTIRDDVLCDDGSSLTAETVANNYRWILDPENGSSFVGLVVPADAVVEHDDAARTVTLTTETPNSFLLPQLGIHPIYCQGALDDPDSVAAATNGTGLYRLVQAVQGDHYTFERKDDYAWGPEGGVDGSTPGVPKSVVVRIIENPSTRANLLLSGELNLTAVQGPDEDRVAASADPLIANSLVTGGFAYSQAEGRPTADEQVRIALTQALDLDALMRVQTADKGERASRLAVLPPQICQYDAATTNLPASDPEAAAATLDDLGWVMGPNGIRERDGEQLTLHFAWNTRWPETSATAELIAEQWAAVGVGVEQDGSEYGVFIERVRAENAASEIDVVWHAANYSVPNVLTSFVAGPVPPTGNNYAAISNPEFDALVGEASQYTGAEACATWEQAESEMYSSADYVPFAMRPEVTYSRGIEATLGGAWDTATSFILVQE
ncbi:peptide/nickel transport system substrate-binding protein [Microcella alkaliphila]|uniref:Peptide/nickel transport system substrate-binding protein n=1 Tax=Microcella alkaliphila TaxID=279828 RepID=A0A4Q7U2F8_9MICO|nr:ABC transporter substrate-binding protein [Microcella alkaliphila]RZT66452.1 peptide/nickel transport system substrate-binding protein [Microcella alkaliphila]